MLLTHGYLCVLTRASAFRRQSVNRTRHRYVYLFIYLWVQSKFYCFVFVRNYLIEFVLLFSAVLGHMSCENECLLRSGRYKSRTWPNQSEYDFMRPIPFFGCPFFPTPTTPFIRLLQNKSKLRKYNLNQLRLSRSTAQQKTYTRFAHNEQINIAIQ